MPTFPIHMPIRIDSYFFDHEVAARIAQLNGGPPMVRYAAEIHPHGVVTCHLGIGGYALETARFRGFEGDLPMAPLFVDGAHLTTYANELSAMRLNGTEDQAMAAMVGAICGATVGIAALGVATMFTSSVAIAAIPATFIVPGALALGLPYRRHFIQKKTRLEALLEMTQALAQPTRLTEMEEASRTAARCRASKDWLLNKAGRQFAQISHRMLPAYEERPAPAYLPPDEDSPLSLLRERARIEQG